MSSEGVELALTAEQVAQILQATQDSADGSGLSLGWMDPAGLVEASSLAEDRKLSKSLLVGFAVLVSFPSDGSLRRLKDVAHELSLPPSTVHRYAQTLAAAGLLEQDPATRCYRGTGRSGCRT